MIGAVSPRLIVAGAALLALAFTGWWVEGAGYRRAEGECRAASEQQERRIDELRRTIEQEWFRQADSLSIKQKEMDDALAEIDRAAVGDDVCLAGDGLRRLQAIR